MKLDRFDEMRQSPRSAAVRRADAVAVRSARRVGGGADRHVEDDYRIIHGHTVRTAMVGAVAAGLAGVPLVYHAHSPTSHDTTRRWRDRLNGVVERLSLRGVSRVIAVSQAIAEHIACEGFDPERIRVVPNGVPSLSTLADRKPPRGRVDARRHGVVPPAQRDRGPAGRPGDSPRPRDTGPAACGGHVRVARTTRRRLSPACGNCV